MARQDRTGVTVVHKRKCASTDGSSRCSCQPSYRAEAWDNGTQRRIYRTFPTRRAAENWRRDTQVAIKSGALRAVAPTTVREAYERWLELATAGVLKARGGADYKLSVLRSYRMCWEGRLLRRLGHRKIGELRRVDVQRLVDALVAEGLAAQTVRNYVTAVRVLCRWAVREELLAANPCDGVELPSGGVPRDRIASPSEALDLVQAIVDVQDRALYATAFFAGLRRGELMGLRWEDVDLANGTISVRRAYEPRTQSFGEPKSKKGRRTLWFPELLRPFLAALDGTEGLVFPGPKGGPFADTSVRDRVVPHWRALGLEPIGFHEARHTYASLMIAAGVNIKAISEFMGHSSVAITWDRYGHLLPGAGPEAAALFNAYLEGALHG